jgi:threonine dehydrogenase-like Zn-dependent dehydrogenase
MGHEYVGVVQEIGSELARIPLADGTLVATPGQPDPDLIPSLMAASDVLAREFGATDIVEERGDAGVEKVKDLTGGLGAHSVIEAVGTQEAMLQAIRSTRPGGHVGFVGVSHDVSIPGDELFMAGVHIHGGPAPVRRFLPELIQLIWDRTVDPGKVFDLTLPLDRAAEGYQAMDQRTATKVLLAL